MREFELALQAASPDANVTLPYWDWAADEALDDSRSAQLWTDSYLGGDGDPSDADRVPDGPFKNWVALVYNAATDKLVPRSFPGLVRRLGRDREGLPTLPSQVQVDSLSVETTYDIPPWSGASAIAPNSGHSFRNRLEGWLRRDGDPPSSRLHNRVHRWVGGDMLPGTSPNDPVFFLHHCNVDRLWVKWQADVAYAPVSDGPPGHNLNDVLQFLESTVTTPAATLDHHTMGYRYDTE